MLESRTYIIYKNLNIERAALGDNSGLDVGEACVLDGEEKVDEEDDPRHDTEAAQRHTGRLTI